MDKFHNVSLPKACKCLEKLLEKNSKDEVYCVGNKVSSDLLLCSLKLSSLFMEKK